VEYGSKLQHDQRHELYCRQEQTRLVSEQLKASLPTRSSSPWTLFKKKELHPRDYLRP